MLRIDRRGHRLDALSGQRRHQPRTVPAQPRMPVGVTQRFTQMRHVSLKLAKFVHHFAPCT